MIQVRGPRVRCALLVPAVWLSACSLISTGKDTGWACEFPTPPYCVDGREWTGNESYCFLETNYSCETAPVENHFYHDADSFTRITDAGISSSGQVIDAIDTAKGKWNTVGANVEIHHLSSDSADGSESGLNVIGMLDKYDTDHDPPWIAYAHYYYPSGAPEEGFTQCVIIVYAKAYDTEFSAYGYVIWDFTDSTSSMATDSVSMPSLLTHEFGHCLGLDDNGIVTSAMNGEVYREEVRDPGTSTDDAQALEYVYE